MSVNLPSLSQPLTVNPQPFQTPIVAQTPVTPQLTDPNVLVQTIKEILPKALNYQCEQTLSTVINLNAPSNLVADTVNDTIGSNEDFLNLFQLQKILLQNSQNSATSIVERPGVVKALNDTDYLNILYFILKQMQANTGFLFDPTKLIYKMIEGKQLLSGEPTAGIEISTTTTLDTKRIRFYFNFGPIFVLRYMGLVHDENYNINSDQTGLIYLFEGTLERSQYQQLLSLVQSPVYQNALPSDTSVLLTDNTNSPFIFLSEDFVPIALEH